MQYPSLIITSRIIVTLSASGWQKSFIALFLAYQWKIKYKFINLDQTIINLIEVMLLRSNYSTPWHPSNPWGWLSALLIHIFSRVISIFPISWNHLFLAELDIFSKYPLWWANITGIIISKEHQQSIHLCPTEFRPSQETQITRYGSTRYELKQISILQIHTSFKPSLLLLCDVYITC